MQNALTTQNPEKIAYWRVIALAVAAFIFNTTEFVPVALLSDIGNTFAIPVSRVGLMMTVYAWVVTLLSLPCMLLTAKWERRRLLMILFVIFIVGHGLSVWAWHFEMLLYSRILIALSHAVFWSITAALAMRVAPKGKQHKALAWLSMGSALAMVLGLPLGRVIGQLLGWRMTFALIGLTALIVLILLYKLLPKLPSENSGSLKSLALLAKRPLLLGIYALTAIAVTAHFTVYSYIEPYIIQIKQLSENATTIALLLFGVSGMVASVLFGKFHQHRPYAFALICLLLLLISVLILPFVSGSLIFVVIFAWGVGMGGLSLCLISRVLQYAPDATDVATAIYSGIFNIGIGGGALLGSVMLKQIGLANLTWVGAILATIASFIFVWINARYTAPSSTPTETPMMH